MKGNENMKKLIFSLLLSLFFLPVCFAENLNFRTNMLTDYHYQINNVDNIFMVYTNNLTEKDMYSINPLKPLDYVSDYQSTKDNWQSLDNTTKNKIVKYIQRTDKEEDNFKKFMMYVNTQMLIWNSFHPEINVQIENDLIAKTKMQMEEELKQIPDWIYDREIAQSFELEKKPDYTLYSEQCQIKETEHTWEISECEENATIWVEEKAENEIVFFEGNGEVLGLEVGTYPCKWSFSIIKKAIEIEKEPEEEKKEEINDSKEEMIPKPPLEEENIPNSAIEENAPNSLVEEEQAKPTTNEKNPANNFDSEEKKQGNEIVKPQEKENIEKEVIQNVPNTKENNSFSMLFILSLMMVICQKRSLGCY